MPRVGGTTNDGLKRQLWQEFRPRQTWFFDERKKQPVPWYSVAWATVKDLRSTLYVLRTYGKPEKAAR